MEISDAMKDRARGCFLGQVAGDALGSLVEFQKPEAIRAAYPEGVRELADGGSWNTIAGQPTDDSEMALLLARMLIREGNYRASAAYAAYRYWIDSRPFDCGMTIGAALHGRPKSDSQANGALMRISPLGLFAINHGAEEGWRWAQEDAALTHPHRVCQDANGLFVLAIAEAVRNGGRPEALFAFIEATAQHRNVDQALLDVIEKAKAEKPQDFITHQGWVLVAFQNALYQLLHAPDLESGVVDSVMAGGDTDTNAAICGALLGALYGETAIPAQWREKVLSCRPEAGKPGVHKPRPEVFWPIDVLELADQLLGV